jgi:hypothetical protein
MSAKLGVIKGREVAKRFDAGKKEVGAASDCGEGWYPSDSLADRPLWNLEFERAVLCADDRIALVAELVKASVVHPDVLGELKLAD